MLVGGNNGGWLSSKERPGKGRGHEEGVEALPEDSSWHRVFSCLPQSPIPLPGQVLLALAERAAGGTSHYPVLTRTPIPGQKPYWSKLLSLLDPPVKDLDYWAEGHLFSLMSLPGQCLKKIPCFPLLVSSPLRKWHIEPTLNPHGVWAG